MMFAVTRADDKSKLDPEKLIGTWSYVSGERNGEKSDVDRLKKGSVTVTKETFTLKSEEATFVMKYTLDTKKSPCAIEIEISEGPQGQGSKSKGIIELNGDEMKLCYVAMEGDAPKEFAAKKDSGHHYFVLKRKK